jgi:hypothetical protein
MKKRCYDPNHDSYPYYGGRGITVCRRWRRSFANFLTDMGSRSSTKHSLEREHNDRDYNPLNCKWATAREQQRNKRDNHVIRFRGRCQCVTAWAEEFGLTPKVVFDRLAYGWSPTKALTTPVREYSRWASA